MFFEALQVSLEWFYLAFAKKPDEIFRARLNEMTCENP